MPLLSWLSTVGPRGGGGIGATTQVGSADYLSLRPPLDRRRVSGDDLAMGVAVARGGADLLEREPVLEGLRKAFADARDGRGGVVLVPGEAGVGKTLVLRRFCDEVRAFARVLWGDCDALFTPRPLGPFADIARVSGDDRFLGLVEGHAKPHAVAGWLLEELASASSLRRRSRGRPLGRRGDA